MSVLASLRPWRELPFVLIDFETTGVDPKECRAVEMAAARFEEGELVGTWSTKLDPECPIPEEAAAIHGIRAADVEGCPSLEEVVFDPPPELVRLTAGAVPAAYNEGYDRVVYASVIERAGGDAGLVMPDVESVERWLDPHEMIRVLDSHVSWGGGRFKLTSVCERHGIELTDAHRAESDAVAAGQLLAGIAKGKIGGCTVTEVLRRQVIHAEKREAGFQDWLKRKRAKEAAA